MREGPPGVVGGLAGSESRKVSACKTNQGQIVHKSSWKLVRCFPGEEMIVKVQMPYFFGFCTSAAKAENFSSICDHLLSYGAIAKTTRMLDLPL